MGEREGIQHPKLFQESTGILNALHRSKSHKILHQIHFLNARSIALLKQQKRN